MKKWTSFLLLCTLVMSMVTGVDVNAEVKNDNVYYQTYENPDYKEYGLYDFNEEELANIITPYSLQAFETMEDAAEYVSKQMVNRASNISLTIKAKYTTSIFKNLIELALQYDDLNTYKDADYLRGHYSGAGCSFNVNSTEGTVTMNMSIKYLTTNAEEQKVDSAVENVINQLNVSDANDYTKIKAVHDYIVQNVKYDYSMTKYSAYNGVVENNVVCNGFALLTYRLLAELGVGVRYIVGKGGTALHAWNIVDINGVWYNLDNTWDQNYTWGANNNNYSGTISYSWFLKNKTDFVKHTRNTSYNTSAFNKLYPMAKYSYGATVKVTSVKLSATKLSLQLGKTSTLSATVAPAEATNSSLSWVSSDTKVATVDGSGNVKAVGEGTAKITATAKDGSGKVATCTVTVVDNSKIKVKTIKLSATTLKLNMGDEKALKATVSPSNAGNKEVTWKSSNTSVATVDENGNVVTVGEGTAKITATAKDGSGVVGTCTVTSTDTSKIKVKTIKISAATLKLNLNTKKALKATISPANAGNKNVTWASSNTSVATVDINGNVVAVGVGTTKITVTAKDGSGIVATSNVTVVDPTKVETIKIGATKLKMNKDTSKALKATVSPSTAKNKEVTWKSSNSDIVTVDGNGKVTAVAAGIATITATAKDGTGVVGTTTITVTDPTKVATVKISAAKVTLKKGATKALKATVSPTTAKVKAVTWKSSNNSVARVDENGKVTAVGIGTATITATSTDGTSIIGSSVITVK